MVHTQLIGETVEKFIQTVDDNFIKPKKKEYYSLLKEYKYCKQIIKDINCRKKIRRKSISQWLWTWVLYFCDKPVSAFMTIKNTKKHSDYFVNEYWILKTHISKINKCIDELDETLDQFELFHLSMKEMDKKFETIEKEIDKYEKVK
jgi:exonuclease VII small subunit